MNKKAKKNTKAERKTTKVAKKHFRQGDVLVVEAPALNTSKMVKQDVDKVTLAKGEVTGHHHTIYGGAIGFADPESKEQDLSNAIEISGESATLTHQEHGPIAIPNGTYEVFKQVEYTPEELKNVRD